MHIPAFTLASYLPLSLLPPPSLFFLCPLIYSEAAVEADLAYMVQPSRIYIADNINVFGRGIFLIYIFYLTISSPAQTSAIPFLISSPGSLVMEHPGSSPSPIQGKTLLYGTVHGAIGMSAIALY